MICLGDLIQDYDATPFVSISGIPSTIVIVVMKERDVDFCQVQSVGEPVTL